MEKLPVPLIVLKAFCWHIRCQHPEARDCSWPAVRSEKTEASWDDIAANYGWALNPSLPWMEEFEEYSTLLKAALQAHNWGPEAAKFPTPARINDAAQQLCNAHRQGIEQRQQRQERTQWDKESAGGCDVMWRCTRLLAYRGIISLNKDNPYAERMDEVLEWAEEQGLPTEPLPASSVLKGALA